MNDHIHDRKTDPLDPDLSDAEQTGKTVKAAYFRAACKAVAAGGESEDVGNRESTRCGAKKDEVWRYSFRSAPGNNAVVLGDVRDEDANEDKTGDYVSFFSLGVYVSGRRGERYMERLKLA